MYRSADLPKIAYLHDIGCRYGLPAQRTGRHAFHPDSAIRTMVHMISIVDDDESVREATNALVRSLGYAAATFASAEEFLSSDRVHATSCVIADVQMPGLSGIDLQQRLLDQGLQVPILFVTAYPDERTRQRALDAGAVDYLSKPLCDEQLVSCLDVALRQEEPSR
jgi:FixJ family two-component response regulator